MGYQVLALRCRPSSFDEIIGQEHVIRTLKNAITSERIAHAYLFSGPRGVGKTSTARILAKAVNCKQGPTPAPCGSCSNCREISLGSSIDVIEIDGASHNSVEDVRELREKVRYAPSSSPYRIYIIDEVHMLSTSAFNALLKTLEEPPAHIKFIFATTEPHKLPATIISRCQHFEFKRVSTTKTVETLKKIAENEGLQISSDCLYTLARAADGSLRDAQGLLDQVSSYSGAQITAEVVEELLGIKNKDLIWAVTDAVLSRDTSKIVALIAELTRSGGNIVHFMHSFCHHIRNLLVLKVCFDSQSSASRTGSDIMQELMKDGILEVGAEESEVLAAQAKRTSREELVLIIKVLIEAEDKISRAVFPRVALEATLLRLAELQPVLPISAVLARLDRLEKRLAGGSGDVVAVMQKNTGTGAVPRSCKAEDEIPVTPEPVPVPEPEPIHESDTGEGKPAEALWGYAHNQQELWQKLLKIVKKKKPSLAAILEHGILADDLSEEFSLRFQRKIYLEQARDEKNKRILKSALSQCGWSGKRLKFTQETDTANIVSSQASVDQDIKVKKALSADVSVQPLSSSKPTPIEPPAINSVILEDLAVKWALSIGGKIIQVKDLRN